MIALGFAVLACIMAGVALALVFGMADNVNRLIVRISKLERKKGIVQGQMWVVTYGTKGKPRSMTFPASDEGDATRQLLIKRIDPSTIITLEPIKEED